MSDTVAEGYTEERKLRRSKRQRKVVTPALVEQNSSSDTETVGSEPEIIVKTEWDLGDSSSEGEVKSFDKFSETAQVDFSPSKRTADWAQEIMSREDKAGSKDSGRGTTPEPGIRDFMQNFFEEQRRRDELDRLRRDDEKRERRDELERRLEDQARREEENRAREDRLFATMRDIRPPAPVQNPNPNIDLPKMRESDEIASFIPIFETALRINTVPEELWKAKLLSHIPLTSLMKVQTSLMEGDMSYEGLVDALMSSSTLTFSAAAEDLYTGERGKIWELEGRKAAAKLRVLMNRVTSEADTKPQMIDCMIVAMMRDKLVPALKTYVDTFRRFEMGDFLGVCEEWERVQPHRTSWFKKNRSNFVTQNRSGSNSPYPVRRPLTCFTCGKSGRVSRECRSRPPGEAATAPHKSPNCPTKPKGNRKVQLPNRVPQVLQHEELFGSICEYDMSITCDTGAQVSIVPIECVRADQLTGETQRVKDFHGSLIEGKVCRVRFQIGGRSFDRDAVAISGDLINWTPCFQVPYNPRQDMTFIVDQMEKKFSKEEEQLYLPPTIEDGVLKSGYMVSGEISHDSPDSVSECKDKTFKGVGETVGDDIQEVVESESSEENDVEEDVTELRDEGSILGESESSASVLEEAEGALTGGNAGCGDGLLSLEGIQGNRYQLAKATSQDESLRVARELAKRSKEGYREVNGVVFHSRMNKLGGNEEQICLPTSYRQKCMSLAHSKFGHLGRNKMCCLIKPYFYWPTISKDCQQFIRACDVCQRADKAKPPNNPMQLREVVTVPFERVAIDIVGPFPNAKGGFKYLLTMIDLATRWPEAIPLKVTTSRVVINNLTNVFTRCGFPKAVVSDNGPQFIGKTFTRWLREQGIEHVRSSPYHPQGNGVVERLHRTLNANITKTAEKKGNWASVVPMALYFIRSLPCQSTEVSPFMARQGWEPSTPIQLLYETWAERDLREVDLEQWVLENNERVKSLRESCSLKLRESMEKRKKTWDSKAKIRVFAVGEEILMRKPGLCHKLEDSWEGPFVIVKQNSPLSYMIDTGDRKIPSVHVSLIKSYDRPEDIAKIGRATSVFEADGGDDDIVDRYAEVKVTGDELDESQKKDVARIMERYGETLNKELGLTELAVFSIDTGESNPFYQQPYNTQAHFKDSINKELDWLLEKNFIRPSDSPWASPIVAVRKPDGTASLCVDFKRVNAVTTNQPFYMPRVEEVLEGVGKSKFISKLDLSKGYYQVKMDEKDICKTAFVCHRGKFEFTRMRGEKCACMLSDNDAGFVCE